MSSHFSLSKAIKYKFLGPSGLWTKDQDAGLRILSLLSNNCLSNKISLKEKNDFLTQVDVESLFCTLSVGADPINNFVIRSIANSCLTVFLVNEFELLNALEVSRSDISQSVLSLPSLWKLFEACLLVAKKEEKQDTVEHSMGLLCAMPLPQNPYIQEKTLSLLNDLIQIRIKKSNYTGLETLLTKYTIPSHLNQNFDTVITKYGLSPILNLMQEPSYYKSHSNNLLYFCVFPYHDINNPIYAPKEKEVRDAVLEKILKVEGLKGTQDLYDNLIYSLKINPYNEIYSEKVEKDLTILKDSIAALSEKQMLESFILSTAPNSFSSTARPPSKYSKI